MHHQSIQDSTQPSKYEILHRVSDEQVSVEGHEAEQRIPIIKPSQQTAQHQLVGIHQTPANRQQVSIKAVHQYPPIEAHHTLVNATDTTHVTSRKISNEPQIVVTEQEMIKTQDNAKHHQISTAETHDEVPYHSLSGFQQAQENIHEPLTGTQQLSCEVRENTQLFHQVTTEAHERTQQLQAQLQQTEIRSQQVTEEIPTVELQRVTEEESMPTEPHQTLHTSSGLVDTHVSVITQENMKPTLHQSQVKLSPQETTPQPVEMQQVPQEEREHRFAVIAQQTPITFNQTTLQITEEEQQATIQQSLSMPVIAEEIVHNYVNIQEMSTETQYKPTVVDIQQEMNETTETIPIPNESHFQKISDLLAAEVTPTETGEIPQAKAQHLSHDPQQTLQLSGTGSDDTCNVQQPLNTSMHHIVVGGSINQPIKIHTVSNDVDQTLSQTEEVAQHLPLQVKGQTKPKHEPQDQQQEETPRESMKLQHTLITTEKINTCKTEQESMQEVQVVTHQISDNNRQGLPVTTENFTQLVEAQQLNETTDFTQAFTLADTTQPLAEIESTAHQSPKPMIEEKIVDSLPKQTSSITQYILAGPQITAYPLSGEHVTSWQISNEPQIVATEQETSTAETHDEVLCHTLSGFQQTHEPLIRTQRPSCDMRGNTQLFHQVTTEAHETTQQLQVQLQQTEIRSQQVTEKIPTVELQQVTKEESISTESQQNLYESLDTQITQENMKPTLHQSQDKLSPQETTPQPVEMRQISQEEREHRLAVVAQQTPITFNQTTLQNIEEEQQATEAIQQSLSMPMIAEEVVHNYVNIQEISTEIQYKPVVDIQQEINEIVQMPNESHSWKISDLLAAEVTPTETGEIPQAKAQHLSHDPQQTLQLSSTRSDDTCNVQQPLHTSMHHIVIGGGINQPIKIHRISTNVDQTLSQTEEDTQHLPPHVKGHTKPQLQPQYQQQVETPRESMKLQHTLITTEEINTYKTERESMQEIQVVKHQISDKNQHGLLAKAENFTQLLETQQPNEDKEFTQAFTLTDTTQLLAETEITAHQLLAESTKLEKIIDTLSKQTSIDTQQVLTGSQQTCYPLSDETLESVSDQQQTAYHYPIKFPDKAHIVVKHQQLPDEEVEQLLHRQPQIQDMSVEGQEIMEQIDEKTTKDNVQSHQHQVVTTKQDRANQFMIEMEQTTLSTETQLVMHKHQLTVHEDTTSEAHQISPIVQDNKLPMKENYYSSLDTIKTLDSVKYQQLPDKEVEQLLHKQLQLQDKSFEGQQIMQQQADEILKKPTKDSDQLYQHQVTTTKQDRANQLMVEMEQTTLSSETQPVLHEHELTVHKDTTSEAHHTSPNVQDNKLPVKEKYYSSLDTRQTSNKADVRDQSSIPHGTLQISHNDKTLYQPCGVYQYSAKTQHDSPSKIQQTMANKPQCEEVEVLQAPVELEKINDQECPKTPQELNELQSIIEDDDELMTNTVLPLVQDAVHDSPKEIHKSTESTPETTVEPHHPQPMLEGIHSQSLNLQKSTDDYQTLTRETQEVSLLCMSGEAKEVADEELKVVKQVEDRPPVKTNKSFKKFHNTFTTSHKDPPFSVEVQELSIQGDSISCQSLVKTQPVLHEVAFESETTNKTCLLSLEAQQSILHEISIDYKHKTVETRKNFYQIQSPDEPHKLKHLFSIEAKQALSEQIESQEVTLKTQERTLHVPDEPQLGMTESRQLQPNLPRTLNDKELLVKTHKVATTAQTPTERQHKIPLDQTQTVQEAIEQQPVTDNRVIPPPVEYDEDVIVVAFTNGDQETKDINIVTLVTSESDHIFHHYQLHTSENLTTSGEEISSCTFRCCSYYILITIEKISQRRKFNTASLSMPHYQYDLQNTRKVIDELLLKYL